MAANGGEQTFVAAPTIGGRGDIIATPFQFLFAGEDNLRIVLINSLAGVVVTMQGRFLPLKGKTPQPFVQTFTPTSDRLPTTFDFSFGAGYLLNVSFIVTSGAPLVGQTYVMLQIIRGMLGAKIVLGCLLGGYITSMQHVAYPGSPILSSTEGEPYVRKITGTQPAFGANISETVPTGARWQLLTFLAGLTTDATVIGRQPILTVRSSGSLVGESIINATIPASTGANVTWAAGLTPQVDATGVHLQGGWITDNRMLAGDELRTTVNNLQAGDRWTAPFFMVREWLEAA